MYYFTSGHSPCLAALLKGFLNDLGHDRRHQHIAALTVTICQLEQVRNLTD